MVRNETAMVECRTAIIRGESSEHEDNVPRGWPLLLRERVKLFVMAGPVIGFRDKRSSKCVSDGTLFGDRATVTARRLEVVMAAGVCAVKIV